MRTLNVDLGDRAYPIHIEEACLIQVGSEVSFRSSGAVGPITILLCFISTACFDLAGLRCGYGVLQDGENHKQIDTLDFIFSEALTKRFSRNATMVALGVVL